MITQSSEFFYCKQYIFILQIFCDCSHIIDIKYDHTKQIFVNSYPWLFPGGIGDIYDIEQGEVLNNEGTTFIALL
jgi:hypothetical protein